MNLFEELDPYELRHFVEHLRDANRAEDAHRVLLQENILTAEQDSSQKGARGWLSYIFYSQPRIQKFYRNAWYIAQQQIGETSNFIKDIRLCWREAETQSRQSIRNTEPAPSIALEARYALIISSLNNLAASIPHSLFSRFLQTNFLTVRQALTYAEQIPDLSEKTLAVFVIALNCDSDIREELFGQSLSILSSIPSDAKQSEIIIKLIQMGAEPVVFNQLVNLARNISSWHHRIETLLEIYPLLTKPLMKDLLAEMLDTAQKHNNQQYRQIILLSVIPFLEEAEKEDALKSIFTEIEAYESEHTQYQLIKKFIEAASDKWLLAARTIINNFENKRNRATAELFFAPRLVANGQLGLVLQIFDRFRSELSDQDRSIALTEIIPFVQTSDAKSIIQLISKISDENHRADLLVKFIPVLPEMLVRPLISSARLMREKGPKAKVFASLAARLADLSDCKLLQESADKIAHKNVTERERKEALIILAPHLPQHLLRQVLVVMQRIEDLSQQLTAIAANSVYLSDNERLDLLTKEVSRTNEITDEEERSEVLVDLIAKITEIGYFEESLKLALNIRSLKWRAKAFSEVYVNTPQEHRVRIYKRIIQYWKPLYNKPGTAEFISYLAPHLPSEFVYEVMNLVANVKLESNVDILISITEIAPIDILRGKIMPLLDHLSSGYNTKFWELYSKISPSMKEINLLLSKIPDNKRWALLVAIAKRLAELGEHEEAFQIACANKHPVFGTLFDVIIPYLPPYLLLKVAEQIPPLESFKNNNNIYGLLAARFTEVGDDKSATTIIHKIYSNIQTSLAWTELVRVSSQSRSERVEKSLDTLERVQQVPEREDNLKGEILSRLADYLSLNQLQRAWLLAIEIENANIRKKALSKLVTKLSDFSQTQIYWFWSVGIKRLSRRSRKNLLIDLQSLAPLAHVLGGETVTYEIIKAINQVGSWWGTEIMPDYNTRPNL